MEPEGISDGVGDDTGIDPTSVRTLSVSTCRWDVRAVQAFPAWVGIYSGNFIGTGFCLREWDLWYVIAPRMNVGINVLWYDAVEPAQWAETKLP